MMSMLMMQSQNPLIMNGITVITYKAGAKAVTFVFTVQGTSQGFK